MMPSECSLRGCWFLCTVKTKDGGYPVCARHAKHFEVVPL